LGPCDEYQFKGVFNCSKAVIPTMIKQQSGKIVNMGSIAGITGGPEALPQGITVFQRQGLSV
jgi:3-oxoacyl-[acyl-carrier protein] reductase